MLRAYIDSEIPKLRDPGAEQRCSFESDRIHSSATCLECLLTHRMSPFAQRLGIESTDDSLPVSPARVSADEIPDFFPVGQVQTAFPRYEKFPTHPRLAIENNYLPSHGGGDFRRPKTCRTASDDGYVDFFHGVVWQVLDELQPGEILRVDQADGLAFRIHHDDVVNSFFANLSYCFDRQRVLGEGYWMFRHKIGDRPAA